MVEIPKFQIICDLEIVSVNLISLSLGCIITQDAPGVYYMHCWFGI